MLGEKASNANENVNVEFRIGTQESQESPSEIKIGERQRIRQESSDSLLGEPEEAKYRVNQGKIPSITENKPLRNIDESPTVTSSPGPKNQIQSDLGFV